MSICVYVCMYLIEIRISRLFHVFSIYGNVTRFTKTNKDNPNAIGLPSPLPTITTIPKGSFNYGKRFSFFFLSIVHVLFLSLTRIRMHIHTLKHTLI